MRFDNGRSRLEARSIGFVLPSSGHGLNSGGHGRTAPDQRQATERFRRTGGHFEFQWSGSSNSDGIGTGSRDRLLVAALASDGEKVVRGDADQRFHLVVSIV